MSAASVVRIRVARTYPSSVCRARGEAEKMEGERETVEGVKLHTKGRVLKAPTIRSEDDPSTEEGPRE